MWRESGPDRKGSRAAWLIKFSELSVPASEIFQKKVGSVSPGRQKNKAVKLLNHLSLLKEQTQQKLNGKMHIKDRIVSPDDPGARPVRKGKSSRMRIRNNGTDELQPAGLYDLDYS